MERNLVYNLESEEKQLINHQKTKNLRLIKLKNQLIETLQDINNITSLIPSGIEEVKKQTTITREIVGELINQLISHLE